MSTGEDRGDNSGSLLPSNDESAGGAILTFIGVFFVMMCVLHPPVPLCGLQSGQRLDSSLLSSRFKPLNSGFSLRTPRSECSNKRFQTYRRFETGLDVWKGSQHKQALPPLQTRTRTGTRGLF